MSGISRRAIARDATVTNGTMKSGARKTKSPGRRKAKARSRR